MKPSTLVLVATPLLAATFCVSLFWGLMITSLGAAFPPLMAVGGPLVCRGGEFGIDSQDYSLPTGQRGTNRSPYCIDAGSGEKQVVTFQLIVVDTLLYAAILFVLFVIPLGVLLGVVMRAASRAGRDSLGRNPEELHG